MAIDGQKNKPNRWHVSLLQVLSEYMTRRYDMIITAETSEKAIEGVLKQAYETDSFTPLLKHQVLHAIPW